MSKSKSAYSVPGKIGKIEYLNVEYVQDWSSGKTITKKK